MYPGEEMCFISVRQSIYFLLWGIILVILVQNRIWVVFILLTTSMSKRVDDKDVSR